MKQSTQYEQGQRGKEISCVNQKESEQGVPKPASNIYRYK